MPRLASCSSRFRRRRRRSPNQDVSNTSPTSARRIALSCRLEALKVFVDEYVTVKWTEGGAA